MQRFEEEKISVEKWGAGDELFNRIYLNQKHTRTEWERIYYTYLTLNATADNSSVRIKERRRRRRR